jgi:hypothetical protein
MLKWREPATGSLPWAGGRRRLHAMHDRAAEGTGMAEEKRKGTSVAGWSAILATWVGVVGAGWGGLQALATYDEEIKRAADARVVQTFALYDMFNRSDMLAVRQRVSDALALTPDLFDEDASAASGGGEAATQTAEAVSQSESHVLPYDLVVYVDFFDAVQVCVERSLCDADLVDRLLKPYAIYNDLKTDIEKVRAVEKDLNLRHPFGSGIEWLDQTDLQALTAKEDE